MFDSTTKSKYKLLSEWSRSNFLGWFFGGFGYIAVVVWFINFYIDTTLFTVFCYLLPFGICISVTQWLILRRWKLQVPLLIPTSFLGWNFSSITVLLVTYVFNQYAPIQFPSDFLIICGISSLIVGASIGFIQSSSLKKSISRLDYWILANALGYFTVATLEASMFVGAWKIKPLLLDIIYRIKLWGLGFDLGFHHRWELISGFMLITLPFLATLFIAIPTGKILIWYGLPKSENENQIAE